MKNINSRFTTDIVNLDKKAPARSRIVEQIVKRQLVRSADDAAKWTQALRMAESAENPDRTELIRIYQNMEIDGHITGIMGAIKNKIKSKEFMIVDANDDENDDETAKFEKEWFFKYLGWSVEAPYYGFSLIELCDIIDDGYPNIKLVPRVNVVPDVHAVKKDTQRFSESDIANIDYTDKQHIDWNIFIGDEKDLGLFNRVASTSISKKHVMAAMWEYAEIFGMPIRQGHTDIHDDKRRLNMERMLDNMGSAAWGVFDRDDEISLIESVKSDAGVFLEIIALANQEISKAFTGVSGMFEEKSFVGSAEVQERIFGEFITSMQRQIMFDINNKLLPRMVKHGTIGEQFKFKWRQEASFTKKEIAETLVELLPFVTIKPDEIEKITGIPVEANVISQELKDVTIANKVREIYKGHGIKITGKKGKK